MKSVILIISAISLTGCAGSQALLMAKSVEPPVSFTGYVFNSEGQPRAIKKSEIVQHFKISKTNWSMLYTSVNLGQKEWDISEQLNEKIKQASGNAIVNVTVSADGPSMLNWYFASLVPIIPSYVTTTVEGDIAKVSEASE